MAPAPHRPPCLHDRTRGIKPISPFQPMDAKFYHKTERDQTREVRLHSQDQFLFSCKKRMFHFKISGIQFIHPQRLGYSVWISYWFNVVLCGTVGLAERYGSMVDLTPNRIHFRLDYILDRTGETFFPQRRRKYIMYGPVGSSILLTKCIARFRGSSWLVVQILHPPPPGLTTTLNCRPREVLGSRYRAGG